VAFPGRTPESFSLGYKNAFCVLGLLVEEADNLHRIPDVAIKNPML
jgi:hypothetical protein